MGEWAWSFLALDHDNVVAKFGSDRRVCVDGAVHRAGLKSERRFLKWANHGAATHPTQVTLRRRRGPLLNRRHSGSFTYPLPSLVFAMSHGYFAELLTSLEFLHGFHHLRVFLAEYVTHLVTNRKTVVT